MSIFKNLDWSAKSIAKVAGMALVGIIAFSVAIALISFSFRTILSGGNNYNSRGYSDGGYGYAEEADYFDEGFSLQSSKISPPGIPEPDFNSGADAEDFEVQNYSGSINTGHLDKTCDTIAILKDKEYVIFENSDKNKESCYYRFKVVKEHTNEIVEIIKDLKPEHFNANIQSIKKSIEGVDNELDILKKKLASIEETLESAQTSYDAISALATRQQDAETLAKIIDSKLSLIEKLSRERLNTKAQIDRYNKSKAEQLDRLNYTFFNINVYKDVLFDWKEIKDSWKWEIKALVRNVNEVFQAITLNLVTYLIRFVQVALYLFVSILLLKFVWIGTKKIWKGDYTLKKRRK